MKRTKRFWNRRRLAALGVLLALMLAGAAAFGAYMLMHSGVSGARQSIDRVEGDADYSLEITPYMDEGALYVEQTITFTSGEAPLDRLALCLPVNAYRRAETAPMDSAEFDAAFDDGYAPGGVEFERISVNGAAVEWGVLGDGEALLTLLCDIAPGQSVTVEMAYHAVLPGFEGAGGIGADEWRLCGFYPYLARLEGGEWTAYAPTYIGQYACAPVSDFDATLHAPEGWDVIAPGAVRQGGADGWSTWRIQMHDARDMGIVLRRGGCAYEREVNGAKVRIYGGARMQARRMVDAAAAALERMSAIYEYPYPALDIVLGDYAGRDESMSGLILIDGSDADAEAQLLYLMARQWWGGLVGVEPMEEPWLSEALAQYTALTCARDAGLGCYGGMRSGVDAALGITLPGGLTVDSCADAFSAQTDYDNVLRHRGAAVLELLDEVSGGGMAQALMAYAQAHAYGYGDKAGFAAALSSIDGGDWSAWLDETLQGMGKRG